MSNEYQAAFREPSGRGTSSLLEAFYFHPAHQHMVETSIKPIADELLMPDYEDQMIPIQ